MCEMEAMDDFGDLYVDDWNSPCSSHSNFRPFDGKNDEDDSFGIDDRELELKDDGSSLLRGKIRELYGFDGSQLLEETSGSPNAENDRGPLARKIEEGTVHDNEGVDFCSFSENSDSEDDLHIVLNEDNMVCSQSMGALSSFHEKRPMSEDEHGDYDMTRGTTLRKDEKRVEDEEVPVRRGLMTNTGDSKQYYHSHSSLRFKVSGRSIHSTSWNQIGHEVKTSSATERRIPSDGIWFDTIGHGFSLPRDKTVFDVNIGSFEKKPWRCPGVDITDFFNFGMDEESWKGYCMEMDQIQKQATMAMRISVSHLVPDSIDSEAVQGSGLDKYQLHVHPKGRTIQVEAGTAERVPSMDLKRQQIRDSDVIQVALQEVVPECKTICHRTGELNYGLPWKEVAALSKLLDHSHVSDDLSSMKPLFSRDAQPSSVSCSKRAKSPHASASHKESELWKLERYSKRNSGNEDEGFSRDKSHASGNPEKSESSSSEVDIIKEDGGNSDNMSSRLQHSPQNGSDLLDHITDESGSDHLQKCSVGSASWVSNDIEEGLTPQRMLHTSSFDEHTENPRAFQCRQNNALKTNVFELKPDGNEDYCTHHKDVRKSGFRPKVLAKVLLEDGVLNLTHNSSKDDLIRRTVDGKSEINSFDGKSNITSYRNRETSCNYEGGKRLERHIGRDACSKSISKEKDGSYWVVSPRQTIPFENSKIEESVAREVGEKKPHKSWYRRRGGESVNGQERFIDEDSCKSPLGYFFNGQKEMYEYLNHGNQSRERVCSAKDNIISRRSHRQAPDTERHQRHLTDTGRRFEVKTVGKKRDLDVHSDARFSLRNWEVDQQTQRYPDKHFHMDKPKENDRFLGKSPVWKNKRTSDMHHTLEPGEIIMVCCNEAFSGGVGYRKQGKEGSIIKRLKEHYHYPNVRVRTAVNEHFYNKDEYDFFHGSISSDATRDDWFSETTNYGDGKSTSEYHHLDNQYALRASNDHEKSTYGYNDVKHHHSRGRSVSAKKRLRNYDKLCYGRKYEFDLQMYSFSEVWNEANENELGSVSVNKRFQNYNRRMCCGREPELDLQVHSFSEDWNEDYENPATRGRRSVNLQKNDWEEKSTKRNPKYVDQIHASSIKVQRVLRKYSRLYTGGEISNRNSTAEDKLLSSTHRGRQLDMQNSGNSNTYMQLEKHWVGPLEVLVPNEDPAFVQDNKKGFITSVGEEPLPRIADSNFGAYRSRCRNIESYDLHHESIMDSTPTHDSKRILETLEKMEKRRERFKEPILLIKESDKYPVPPAAETTESIEGIQRPSRKRKWSGA